MTSLKFCILLRNCVGKKKEKGLIKSTTSKVDILSGSLLLFIFNDTDHSSNQNICVLETLDPENIEVRCSNEDFDGISKEEYEVLVSIPTCYELLTIYLDKHWLQEGLELNVNDYVCVYDKASSKDLIGILRYKGAIVDLNGIFFGVEYILNDIAKGISDGVFRKHRYFTCAPNCAAFVALHRIRKCSTFLPTEEAVELVGATNFSQKWNLKIKDRVVWYSDDGPEYGTVKWIGLLPGTRFNEDVTVGVEFDNPVGNGTGKYKDHRLFTAKQNHASLVPMIGLLKAEDISPGPQYEQVNDDVEEQRRIYEDLRLSKENRTSGAGNHYLSKANTPEYFPVAQKPVNPLYEYSRSESEYLPENLAPKETLIQNSSNSRQIPNNSSQQDTQHDPDLTVGSLVEVMSNRPLYGVIKWIGNLPDQKKPQKLIAGLEMEDEIAAGTDGILKQHRLFTCPPKKGFFVPLYKCRKDKRFFDDRANQNPADRSLYFGSNETPDLEGSVSPPRSLHDVTSFCGKGKGIQGHLNSCNMDAVWLAMFYSTTVFDPFLHCPKNAQYIPEYGDVQQVLKKGIVNPLRKHHYVRADKMTKRGLLDKFGKILEMMSEEKAPRCPTNWRKGNRLGRGAFGEVYECFDHDSGRQLAVKLVKLNGINADVSKEVRALENELILLRTFKHERIVQYYGSAGEGQDLMIFMEYMPRGSVFDIINKFGALQEAVAGKYTRQILEGLAYLHTNLILHRDIKGANVLLNNNGNVKLSDFGTSKRLRTIRVHSWQEKGTVVGTPYWMAPEVINGEHYGRNADVWSVGCTVVEMLTKKPPWSELETVAAIFKIGTADEFPKYQLPDGTSDRAHDFLRLVFRKNFRERPTSEDLLSHPFVNW